MSYFKGDKETGKPCDVLENGKMDEGMEWGGKKVFFKSNLLGMGE